MKPETQVGWELEATYRIKILVSAEDEKHVEQFGTRGCFDKRCQICHDVPTKDPRS